MEFIIRLNLKTQLSERMIKRDIKYIIQDYLEGNGIKVKNTAIGVEVEIKGEEDD